ncbi:putative TIR domain, P-loop containing nucleoside triphosphate hydrolase [Rosa chinensis]|uniref:Putative TIR domain, P-loop containing nucleoside triphosphate hydrolase n=1 Tax=Rosa chinensis TaxID=74649 RepID=A0A2P6QLS8_ROSCH|nr:probable disease resistance protein At1g61300 isoform X2 [Rosa chinensis]PRQ35140.1 putative TIR domain, P-loop containing nucleoside triphosphate hydrolase [Rosa chinensis]
MEFFEISVAIIVVIVTWSCKAIIKWIWTLVKRWFSYMVGWSEDNQILVDMDASASLSSSSTDRRCKHHVFLSFRGPDARKGIAFEVYNRLQGRGIKTFKDDRDLEVGDAISSTLIAAIEESRFAIVVLSRDYASSTWCLEELAKICECMKDQNRILPLFYNVEPSDVRFQKKSFKEAFDKHVTSGRHRSEKVKQWRDALNKVAGFSGWNMQDYNSERELVDAIVYFVYSKIESTLSTGDFEAFEATKKAMDEVMEGLQDDEVTATAVYGMGGVGKTTMVKEVGAQFRKSGVFHRVIMGVVSKNPDSKNLQDTLAEQLGFKLWQETEIGRAAWLHEEIMRREKLLIILDDVWERTDLSKIGIPSYKELQKCKSKVILTTRISNVCHTMECQRKITLNILSEQDSWKLFMSKARQSFESTEFKDIARKVAGECKGLPVALIAVARALGDKDLAEWEKAAQRLQKSQRANPDDKGDVFECIKLSYDHLKDEDHKSCFLLCCLYPEDHDIRLGNLFKYAIGTGLFRRDAVTIEEARGIADSAVKYLKASSLLLDSEKNGCVKMHDVIRDTALNIAKSKDGHEFLVKAGYGLKHWPCGSHQGYSAISLMRNEIHKLPEEELVGISDAKYIPKTVEAKPDWDYFHISIIGRHASIKHTGRNHNSRSLFLNGATMSTLPDWFINAVTKKTEKLEYMSCKGMSDILMEHDHGRLHKLKHLKVWDYFLDSSVCLKELMNTTRRVQKGPVFEKLEELHLIHLIHLEELCVGELPPGSLSNLKELHIFFCNILKNVSKLVQRLPNLEKLDLNCLYNLEYVFVSEGFEPKESKMREIYLSGPCSVKSICSGPAPRVMFESLKLLTFYRCELLQSLFASDVAKCLDQLEDLFVEQCPLLERVIEAANNKKTVFPKMKNLVLKNLPLLYGASATVDIECPSLELLTVVDCAQISFSTTSSLFHSFESRNQFSFSTSASNYFGSTTPVQLNDPQLYQFVHDRCRSISGFQS